MTDLRLHLLNLTGRRRAVHRARTAQLLRLIRRSKRDSATPSEVVILDPDDQLHVALWSLGAFKRDALAGGVWINEVNGWPVVRHPASLQYLTLDVDAPLSAPTRFPYPRYSYLSSDDTILSVQ